MSELSIAHLAINVRASEGNGLFMLSAGDNRAI